MKKPIVIITKPNEVTIKQDRIALIQMAADDIHRKKIAEQVGLSVRTVELHFNNLKNGLDPKVGFFNFQIIKTSIRNLTLNSKLCIQSY